MLFAEKPKAILECLLFATAMPLSIDEIASVLELSLEEAEELLFQLMREYNDSDRGLQITLLAEGYQMGTKPQYAPYLEKICRPRSNPLSKPALETLAIIAYRQPITRTEIEAIRGVRVEHLLSTLIERDLIKEIGRKEGPGRPILYGTTSEFLIYLGLKSLEDLPPLDKQQDGIR
ncbi:MAG: SMC-Scp complex subunit ScpB [Bacillota bacterium]